MSTRRQNRQLNAHYTDILQNIWTLPAQIVWQQIQNHVNSENRDLHLYADIIIDDFNEWVIAGNFPDHYFDYSSGDPVAKNIIYELYRQQDLNTNIDTLSPETFLQTYIPPQIDYEFESDINVTLTPAEQSRLNLYSQIDLSDRFDIENKPRSSIMQPAINMTLTSMQNISDGIDIQWPELPVMFPNEAGMFNNFFEGFDLQNTNAKYIIFGIGAILTGYLLSESKAK